LGTAIAAAVRFNDFVRQTFPASDDRQAVQFSFDRHYPRPLPLTQLPAIRPVKVRSLATFTLTPAAFFNFV